MNPCRRLLCAALVALATMIAFFAMARPAMAADQPRLGKIGASAVWQMPASFLGSAHVACDKSAGSGFADCFFDQMAKSGASPDAVAFSRELDKVNHGDVGIMSGFQPVGPLDIAWVTYPLRANTNTGFLLVNGQPPMIDVENLQLLDQKTMKQSPQFQDLKGQFAQVDVWPGDRDGKTWPNSQKGADGSVQFVADYPLINGCHACARAGSAYFNWNFDAKGKFLGTTFIGITAAPLK